MAQRVSPLLLGLLALPLLLVVPAYAQSQVSLIPKPTLVEMHQGAYVFPSATPLAAFDAFTDVADLLYDHPSVNFMAVERIKSHKRIPETGVRLVQARDGDRLAKDAYRLVVDTSGIVITAHQAPAMINGILTVLQLAYTQPDGRRLPAMVIEDKPRFGYRGLHLDVSRHFYPLPFLKKFVDLMALYKFNTFHWHLADGAGWRLEINKYPKLTQKAAWRTHAGWKEWMHNGQRYLPMGEPNASGGYYTQAEARQLVAYAARKGITIIPEIEIPGHSEEVLAVYPELSCTGEPYRHNTFCIGNEATSTFFEDVLTEIIAIFPSEYIHIGGGEVDKAAWAACDKCKARVEQSGLDSIDALQRYAVGRIDSFLRIHGRKSLGWDETMDEGAPGTTIMSRHGGTTGLNAATAGHDVVMTPDKHLSFDQYQSDPRTQPEAAGGYIPLSAVYAYEPIPAGLAADKVKHILGAQGNIWTAYMPTTEQVEYMAFPRALALAEVAWSDPARRDWDDFNKRLQRHYQLLQRWNVNYCRPSYAVGIDVDFNADTLTNTITLATEQSAPGIRYTTDGQEPDAGSALYSKPIELAVPATINAAFFVDSGRVGPIATAKADIHKAIGKNITYQTVWDESFPAQQDSTLLNGQKGGALATDGQWQGFVNNVDVTIDFQRREAIKSVAIDFLQDPSANGYLPGDVTVLLSDNGKNFREAGTVRTETPTTDMFREVKTYAFNFDAVQTARYVRVVATNARNALLLTDEVVVY
ncbi:glycoside hydrolase family 20 protein [Parapedobacter sp. 10938]|uniref:glycoside hydrolase family 20 protein n=1 Tax=Parapedobacter flavus TaxID=3110225 RepID=UPI002DB607BF|nr:family 20 glycosylhydrolase [Parapedobacter sp. 10938]MEC3878104.1 family 20 glycosylhydrolase [Parapedobacter sp. 10938]